MVETEIRRVIASLLDRDRLAAMDQWEAAERERRATVERTWIAEQLSVLREVMLELGISDDESGDAESPQGSGDVEGPGNAAPGRPFWTWPPSRSYWFLEPEEKIDEPLYDVSVVSGMRNSRERAMAAARVYGPRLKEAALAEAIFLTGETRAANAASVRGALGGLVKHGRDWRREGGWLIYQGDGLKPDRETILRLIGERQASRQAAQEEEIARIESF